MGIKYKKAYYVNFVLNTFRTHNVNKIKMRVSVSLKRKLNKTKLCNIMAKRCSKLKKACHIQYV